jgi:class 3 adenylate cyclase
MEADEEGTLAQVRAHRRALIDPRIKKHRAQIIKTPGDSGLVEFASVVDVVHCAVKMRRVHGRCGSGVVSPSRSRRRLASTTYEG